VKRIGAFVLAVAMVAAAFWARGALGTDGEDEAVNGTEQPAGIVCASDLAEICAAAGVPLAGKPAAGDTADALIAADQAADLGGRAWLTTSAWASVVMDERTRNRDDAIFEVASDALASSAVTLAIWEDRAAQLSERCGQAADAAPGWRCLAEQSGTALQAGDRVQVASPDVGSAVGLVVAASQAAGLLGTTDFASNDFELGDFRSLAASLARGQSPDPLRTMRSQGPGQVTAAATVRARATNLSSTFGAIFPTTPGPAVRADVVLVVPTGSDIPEDQRAALAEALVAASWDPPSGGPDGLPSGGVLAAIRTLWTENR
jgi:hypothetical protein